MNMKQNDRNLEIDGLRGWAAFIVLIFHFFKETFVGYHPDLDHKGFGVFFDGHLMVYIFFILSGDALSQSFFLTNTAKNTPRIVIARYFRLTFPILVTCFLSFLFVRFGLTYNHQAALIVGREDWLGTFLNFEMSFVGFLRFSIEEVYMHHRFHSSYNPFLWTMSIEMLGSILIFLNVFVFNNIKKHYWKWILIFQFVFFLYFTEYLALFYLGMLLGYLRNEGFFQKLNFWKHNYFYLLLFVSVVFFLMPFAKDEIYSVLDIFTFKKISPLSYTFLYAGLIVILVYASLSLKKFFANKLSLFLGEISFPIYILQFNVLVTLTSWLIIKFEEFQVLNTEKWLIIPIISIITTVMLGIVFRNIEKRVMKVVNTYIKEKMLVN